MSKLILYLLESSAVLALLYSLYLLLLRKETFFSLNRFYLLAILVFSFLIPLMSFKVSVSPNKVMEKPIEQLSVARLSYYEALSDWNFEGNGNGNNQVGTSPQTPVKWINSKVIMMLLLSIYGVGVLAALFRLVWVYRWIYQLKNRNPKMEMEGMTVVKVPYEIPPFSFMSSVFICENLIGTDEFRQILAHERTHIEQRHSADLLIVQLLAAFLWFNPVAWWLIKSLKTTHEYIADKKMINQGYSLVEYQSLLLRQLISNNSFGLVHNFNLSFIKNRITMMKIKDSGWAGRAKVAFALSFVVIFGLIVSQCNSKIDDQNTANLDFNTTPNLALPVLPETGYKFDGDLSNSIEVSIFNDQLWIDGEPYQVSDIGTVIKQANLTERGFVVMKVDKDQSMSLVRKVEWELREANSRRMLYIGQTSEGNPVEMTFLLPATPGSSSRLKVAKIDDEFARKHDLDLYKVDLSNDLGAVSLDQTYDFVKGQIEQGKSNYVVSVKYDDNTSYGHYLSNLNQIQEAFNQIYEERTKEMFGKSFFDLDRTNTEEKEQYDAVRKGVPRAISIAER